MSNRKRVVVTGAAGHIGRLAAEELGPDHDLVLIDRRPFDDPRAIVADLSRSPSPRAWWPWGLGPNWPAAVAGADVVLHLAAIPDSLAPRWRISRHNVRGTRNVLAAAVSGSVRRVVFASSTFATLAVERRLAPDCYRPDGPKIGSSAPADPVSAYGASKAEGERMGRQLVESGALGSFITVRIGWCPVPGSRPPTESDREWLHRRWIGEADMAALLRRCVDADYEGFRIVYGVSDDPRSPFDLGETRRLLGWSPRLTL